MIILRAQPTSFKKVNTLFQVISTLSKEEARFFKLYATRTNSSDARKDLLLFDQLKKPLQFDEDKFAEKHYGNKKNAYYRLKNRLLNDINKSLMLQHIEKEVDLSILKTLLVSRVFRAKGKCDLTRSYLKKAEKKCIESESFELLNMVYNDLIKLSHDDSSINVEDCIKKRKSNNERRIRLHEIDDVLAVLNYRLKSAQNFSGSNEPVIKLLEKTIEDFSQSSKEKPSAKFKVKIYQAVSRILLQRHDFRALEEYLIYTFSEFENEKLFNKNTHEVKLQMLTYLINCLFKNKKIKQSLEKTQELQKAMREFDGILYDKFLFYYYNSLVINYSVSDKDKAQEILIQAKGESLIKDSSYNYFFICSNLALLYFDKGRFKPAIKELSRIMLHKNFVNFADSFQIKIIAAELIIRSEIGDFDYLEQRILQVRKKYKTGLNSKECSREKLLLEILEALIYTSSIKSNKSLMKKIEALFQSVSIGEAAELDVINYNKWLKDKF